MSILKYSEVLRLNRDLKDNIKGDVYNILLLSNVVIHQSKDVIEYFLRYSGINVNIELGDYDNVVQDSYKNNGVDAVIIFWELSNLVDGLPYKIELLSENEIGAIERKIKAEISLTIKNFENCPTILINKFDPIFFTYLDIESSKLDKLAYKLNHFLEENVGSNVKLINLNKIIATVGLMDSFDFKYFYLSKMPYTFKFFKAYAQFIRPFFLSAYGKAKKALIFDCDNTLWGGILGEDGFNGIDLSSDSNKGLMFQEVQSIALSLSQKGVLLGLCSKNNPEDVDKVLNNHPGMVLKDKHITIKEVGWLDKVTSLKNISKKLNIGLDSLVFIDDSPFEVNLVRSQLPEVTVFQVPENFWNYSTILRSSQSLFYNISKSIEDGRRCELYKNEKQRNDSQIEYSTIENYLSSLGLKVKICKNNKLSAPRIAQLTQKTNQFNLTTKRYTEKEIMNFILSLKNDIYTLSVEDKFGDSGITGLCIVSYSDNVAFIDSFLLSCRVIGRNIEYIFMDFIINTLSEKNIKNVISEFIQTTKNTQVQDFYYNCSFDITNKEEHLTSYDLTINRYKESKIEYIEVIHNE